MPFLSELNGDLFEYKGCLVHCVSKDFRMGKGIALSFKNKYGRVDELLRQNKKVGEIAYLQVENNRIYYLITKEYYWQKPTLKSLKECLYNLLSDCQSNNIKDLAMPKIGCGLDKLNWDSVKKMIINILIPHINVTIYYLE